MGTYLLWHSVFPAQEDADRLKPGLGVRLDTVADSTSGISGVDPPTTAERLNGASQTGKSEEFKRELEQALRQPGSRYRDQYIVALFERWGKVDAAGAIDAMAFCPERLRRESEIAVFKGWVVDSPHEAWSEVVRIANAQPAVPGATRQFMILEAMVNTLVGLGEARTAAILLESLPAISTKLGLIHRFSREWMAIDSDSAVEWLQTIENEDSFVNALTGMTETVATTNPRLAMEWAVSWKDPEYQALATMSIMRGVVEREGLEGADNWFDVMEANGFSNDIAVVSVLSDVARDNPELVDKWITRMSDERMRSSALKQAFGMMQKSSPEHAVRLALKWYPEADRAAVIPRALRHWAKSNRSAALEYVNTQLAIGEAERLIYIESINAVSSASVPSN